MHDEDWSEIMGFKNGTVKKTLIGCTIGLGFTGIATMIGIPLHNNARISAIEVNQEWTHSAITDLKDFNKEVRIELRELKANQLQILQELRRQK